MHVLNCIGASIVIPTACLLWLQGRNHVWDEEGRDNGHWNSRFLGTWPHQIFQHALTKQDRTCCVSAALLSGILSLPNLHFCRLIMSVSSVGSVLQRSWIFEAWSTSLWSTFLALTVGAQISGHIIFTTIHASSLWGRMTPRHAIGLYQSTRRGSFSSWGSRPAISVRSAESSTVATIPCGLRRRSCSARRETARV